MHVSTPIEVCRARDTRGVYARADEGELGEFPGVSAPYDPPLDADLVIDTSTEIDRGLRRRVLALLDDARGLGMKPRRGPSW